ncbi:PREDICTED: uncharacterized protein LOC104729631 [Camelina sativa]|uniref:Uncharacterized protein LOC104729631 n=1 Tax=Camelina sativa TaxID=90675 RepID=A0ABM0UVC2_CAMSA|nr:PREDICTED: uncharacterized protein LOC104729631 [Camelina sativa]
MSNTDERKLNSEEEGHESSDDSGYLSSDEKGEIHELVLALPALSLAESFNVDETIREDAAVAATLIVDAAKEAAVAATLSVDAAKEAAGKKDQTGSGKGGFDGAPKDRIKVGRPRVLLEALAGASGSTVVASTMDKEPIKKARKKGSTQLTNPPKGPPTCNICGIGFGSWKAVFGHLSLHKDRGYQGFLPPPTFNAAEEGFGGTVAASSGGGGSGSGTGGLEIDLNVDVMEEDEGGTASGVAPKFDLNRSPPQEDGKEDDKAK